MVFMALALHSEGPGVCALALPLIGCVALGKLLNFSVSHILYPKQSSLHSLHYRVPVVIG